MNEELVSRVLTEQDLMPVVIFTYEVFPKYEEVKAGEEYEKLTDSKPLVGMRVEDDKLFPHDYRWSENISVITPNGLNEEDPLPNELEVKVNQDNSILVVGVFDKNTKIPLPKFNNRSLGDIIGYLGNAVEFNQDMYFEALNYLRGEFKNTLMTADFPQKYGVVSMIGHKDIGIRVQYQPQ